MSTQRVHSEILKLLIQVAWADGKVPPEEKNLVLGLAREFYDANTTEQHLLDRWLKGEIPLPVPDIGFLRNHRDAVITAVQAVILADNKVATVECTVLAEIRRLLT